MLLFHKVQTSGKEKSVLSLFMFYNNEKTVFVQFDVQKLASIYIEKVLSHHEEAVPFVYIFIFLH